MRRALPRLVAVPGVALAVAGVAVLWWTTTRPPSGYGWTAYAPLEEVDSVHGSTLTLTSGPGSVVRDPGHLVGAALAAAGAPVPAPVGGWVLGRRSAR
ncbi:hypothetical protein [Geodermatophilus sp. SYSU D00684]